MRYVFPAILAFSCVATSAIAADEPYIAAGQRLAEANCAQCHNIEPGGAFKLYPPSFAAIAAYLSPEIMRMKVMYPDHALLMPQFHTFMFEENLDNIVGYIQSLEE